MHDFHRLLESLWLSIKCSSYESTQETGCRENIYNEGIATINLHKVNDKIPILKGVRQGDTLYSKLFMVVLEEVFKNLEWKEAGIHLLPGGILQERYLWGCARCCKLSDSLCPFFPVPFVFHLHKRAAAACHLKTTSTTTYITLCTPYTFTHTSTQNFKNGFTTPSLGFSIWGGNHKCS